MSSNYGHVWIILGKIFVCVWLELHEVLGSKYMVTEKALIVQFPNTEKFLRTRSDSQDFLTNFMVFANKIMDSI